MPYVHFLLICLVWGSNFILMERASHALGPVEIAIGRLGCGAAVLGVAWCWGRNQHRIPRRDWFHIAGVALFANAWPFMIQPLVIGQGFGHSYFSMMVALVPLATILASIPLLGIWPTVRQGIGVLGGLVCLGVILQEGTMRGMPIGLLALAVTVPVVYAIGNTYIKRRLTHIGPLPLTTSLLAIGAAGLLPLEFFPSALDAVGIGRPADPQDWLTALGAVAFMGAVGTGATILLFVRLIQQQGPLFAGMVTYVVPVVGLVWGRVDAELITSRQVLAMLGVLAMVALVQFNAAQKPIVADVAPAEAQRPSDGLSKVEQSETVGA